MRINDRVGRTVAIVATGVVAAAGLGVLAVTAQAQAEVPPVTVSAQDELPPTGGELAAPVEDEVHELNDPTPAAHAPFVSYDGPQSGPFATAAVPQGWVVRSSDDVALVIGPAESAGESDWFQEIGASVLEAGTWSPYDAEALLGTLPDGGGEVTPEGLVVSYDWGSEAVFLRPDGTILSVSFPVPTGGSWTLEEMLEFGRGVTVTGPVTAVNRG